MSPRELMVVLLRVLGIWELINACAALTAFLQIFARSGLGGPFPWSQMLWPLAAGVGVHFVACGLLLWFAEPLAAFFYPRGEESSAGERTTPLSFAERLSQIPAAHRLRFWICSAGLVTLLYFGLIARSKVWFTLGTLHTLFLITLGCSAAAFLLRKTLPPLEGFLAAWSVAFAMYTAMFALRLVP
jgi:hypothetical protein